LPWVTLKFRVGSEQAEQAAELLESLGAHAVSFEDAGDEPLFDQPDQQEENRLWRSTSVNALFDADVSSEAIAARLGAALGTVLTLEQQPVPDQDWERAWLDQWHPLQFGNDLWVCPSWCAPPDPAAVNLILDPGLAFGTGTHPTTALCLEWLSAHRPLTGNVIDYGCGSGILAIAALKLGARHAFGVDVDARALAVSEENALRNGVADRYTAVLPADLPRDARADIVVANILAGPLVALAPTLIQRVEPGGALLLSGLLMSQVAEVRAAYAPYVEFELHQREDWALLAGKRGT
jgi:ribosomal protein L11 methyltransferase